MKRKTTGDSALRSERPAMSKTSYERNSTPVAADSALREAHSSPRSCGAQGGEGGG